VERRQRRRRRRRRRRGVRDMFKCEIGVQERRKRMLRSSS
jgi:hypothetical protein